jgi:hypothetical protein
MFPPEDDGERADYVFKGPGASTTCATSSRSS